MDAISNDEARPVLMLVPTSLLYPRLDSDGDDYIVVDNDFEVGRIRKEGGNRERWLWANKVLPNSNHDRGDAASLDEAKAAFRARWVLLSKHRKISGRGRPYHR